jgi:hypothetical protein
MHRFFSYLHSNFFPALLFQHFPKEGALLHPMQTIWGWGQTFLGGKKYFLRKINFRGTRKMKTSLPKAKNKYITEESWPQNTDNV